MIKSQQHTIVLQRWEIVTKNIMTYLLLGFTYLFAKITSRFCVYSINPFFIISDWLWFFPQNDYILGLYPFAFPIINCFILFHKDGPLNETAITVYNHMRLFEPTGPVEDIEGVGLLTEEVGQLEVYLETAPIYGAPCKYWNWTERGANGGCPLSSIC